MSGVGRVCLYCSKAIETEDRICVCDRCHAAHHKECWERNGRCSTFRCPGAPRLMFGMDLGAALAAALIEANSQPVLCPFCGNRVYPGDLHGRHERGHTGDEGGLVFVSAARRGGGGPVGWLRGMMRGRSWLLPGAVVPCRSCGKCRRLFVWGIAVGEGEVEAAGSLDDERFCPRCGVKMEPGRILLRRGPGAVMTRFVCTDTPDFHRDWFGHQILDRFVLNRWNVRPRWLDAHSCAECQYTEVGAHPIYRML